MTGIIVDRVFVMFWRVAAMTVEMTRKSRVRKLAAEAKMLKGDFDGWPPSTDVIVEGLTAGYDGTTVLHDLSLRIPASTTLVVIGPNGCGKTTLIRALGLFKSASFRVQKRAVAGSIPDKPGQWAGIVLQDSPVFGHLTVWGNVAVGAHLRRVPRAERNSLTYSALDRFGLVDLASRQADTLSGGQRQRLALASAVTNRPRVLLLDEPFAALDWFRRRELQEYYREAVAGNVTAIFVTHDLHEALCVGDYIRVGLDPDAVTFRIERRGLSVREWERAREFAETRERIVAALEDVYGRTRIDDSLPERGRKSPASRT